MAKSERINRLITILQQKNGASVKELAKASGVTEMTIRRDLRELSESGKVDLVRGVAIYRPDEGERETSPYSFLREQKVRSREKERIGLAAAGLVESGDVIFLDMGTTASWVARYIPQNMKITVMCCSMNVLTEVRQKNVDQIIMSGGFYHKDTQVFECTESVHMMKSRRASKAFIAPAGASMALGLTCNSPYEVELKRVGLDHAVKKILLLDSTKFGKVCACCFGDWDQIDMVITDAQISEEWKAFLQEKGIELMIV